MNENVISYVMSGSIHDQKRDLHRIRRLVSNDADTLNITINYFSKRNILGVDLGLKDEERIANFVWNPDDNHYTEITKLKLIGLWKKSSINTGNIMERYFPQVKLEHGFLIETIELPHVTCHFTGKQSMTEDLYVAAIFKDPMDAITFRLML
jgi:hypothetical protein